MSEIDQTSPGTCEEELLSIKKKLRYQEGEWKKNKAVLEQRIEILELQNRELKEREENLKKMNNSIFSALKDFNKENDPTYSKIIRELEASKQQISREYADHRIRNQETMKNVEKENKELREKISELETKHNLATLHYEKNDAVLHQKIESLETEKISLNATLKLYEEERKQLKEKELNQNELQSKLSEVRYLLEKHTNDHRKELDRVRTEYAQAFNDMKTLAESEKNALENQIRKLLENKKLDGTLFEDIKKNHENEIKVMRRERENLWSKNQGLEQQIVNLNDNIMILEDRLAQQKAEHEKEAKEFRKYKLKMMDTENLLRKYEQTEKNLKQMITEKEYKLEEATSDLKKKLATEKRRYEQAQEIAKKYKEEGEKRCGIIMQESMKKDEIIKKLKSKAKIKEDKSHAKDQDTTKTNTSLVNMSLVNQSLSTSKYNPSRSFIQEVKTSRDANGSKSIIQVKKSQSKFSHDFTQKGPGKETQRENTDIEEDAEDLRDLTNENILLGLDSPRASNTVRTHRNRNRSSNKKDIELSVSSVNRLNEKKSLNLRRADKSITQDHLCQKCNQSMDIEKGPHHKPSYLPRKNTIDGSKIYGQHQNQSSASFELKKKSTSFCDTDSNYPQIKISSPVLEMGKMTPIDHDNSRSYFHINELGDHLSVNKTNKSLQSIEPNSANVSRGFQDMLDSNQKVTVSEFQQGGAEDLVASNRGKLGSPEERVKELEDKLLKSEQKSEKTALELEKKQVELDRLILELKQTKMEWALSEESKEECELTLKNEIKFLISKLLQVKNGGTQEENSQIMKSSNLNKSNVDPQSSYINTSGFLNVSHYNPVHHFGSLDQSSMINNLGGEKHLSLFSDKKGQKNIQKILSEDSSETVPLRNKCMNSGDLENLNDSPRRVSEFNNNENNLLLNLLNTSTNPKKLMRHVKR